MASKANLALYLKIYNVRPRCPITGRVGNEIHHCLLERGYSGLNPRDQHYINQPWNCVLLSTEGHALLHGSDPSLNAKCIQSLLDFYGRNELETQIAAIPFRVPTTLDAVLQRNHIQLTPP